jgi:hypothetical protein
MNDGKLKDPRNLVSAFNKFFLTVTEKWYIDHVEKEDAVSFLKDLFVGNFRSIKIIPITEAEIKCLLYFLKTNNSSGYDEITSKIL